MWDTKRVSVVLTSYREKGSIRSVIEEFFATGLVDEIVVVDNNAEPGSVEEVQKTRARLVFEKRQGHGWALQRGMQEAAGEYVLLCEADGTFQAEDVEKFLAYARHFSVVLGTRTNTSFIEPGSAMFFLRRVADILEGKFITVLFNAHALSDVGCTYKLLRKDVIRLLENEWVTHDSHFVTEITLQAAARRVPFIEIPVAFKKRVGESAMTGTFFNVAKWGIKLFLFIWWFWLRWLFWGLPRPYAQSAARAARTS